MENGLKTGTTTVGILCKDGIILAADKRATAGHFIADKNVTKVESITDNMAVTFAGTVSDIQMLVKLIRAQIKLDSLRRNKEPKVKEAANLLAHYAYSSIRRMFPGVAHFLFGGKDVSGFHLFDIYPDGSISSVETFIASGSGSMLALGTLEANYKKDCSVADGIKLALLAINTAISRDSASGEGIDIIKITKDGVEHVTTKKIEAKLTL